MDALNLLYIWYNFPVEGFVPPSEGKGKGVGGRKAYMAAAMSEALEQQQRHIMSRRFLNNTSHRFILAQLLEGALSRKVEEHKQLVNRRVATMAVLLAE
jgi:hypothetical protein